MTTSETVFDDVFSDIEDEIARRLVHVSTSVIPLSYVFLEWVTWRDVQAFLSLAVLAAFGLEVVRLFVGLDWRIFDRLTRPYERENLAGYFLGAVGLTVVALAFRPPETAVLIAGIESPVAVPAMLLLTVVDPFSGLLGSGELRPAKQAWVLLATFGLATLIAGAFVPLRAAVAGGLATTFFDGVKPVVAGYVIDDNLTIPVGSAVAMVLVLEYLPAIV